MRAHGLQPMAPAPRPAWLAWTRATRPECLSAPLTKVSFSHQLDILCNEEILGKDHTLKFVVVTRWRFKVRRSTQNLLRAACVCLVVGKQ